MTHIGHVVYDEFREAKEVWAVYWANHWHGRRMPMMKTLTETLAKRCCGGSLEPNTNPHLYTARDVEAYIDQANRIAPDRTWRGSIYLAPDTDFKEIQKAWQRKLITHVKWYPPHGSTHSGESVQPEELYSKSGNTAYVLDGLQDEGIPFKTHGEIVEYEGEELDAYEREACFFLQYQPRIREARPRLRQISAHITTSEAVSCMENFGDPYYHVAEITSHHFAFDRRILYDGGFILVDHHCLPVVKAFLHNVALRNAAKKKPEWLIGGADEAAHDKRNKYALCAFGGYYTYHCSLELYVQVCEELGILDFLPDFLYGNAKRFLGDLVPDNPPPMKLVRKEWTVNSRVGYEDGEMTPFGYHDDPEKRFRFGWQLAA